MSKIILFGTTFKAFRLVIDLFTHSHNTVCFPANLLATVLCIDLLLQEQWQVYCAMRWGVNKAEIKIKIPPKSIHLRVLYPLTYPLPIAQSNRQDSGKAGLSRVTSSDHLQVSEDGTNLKVSFTGVSCIFLANIFTLILLHA